MWRLILETSSQITETTSWWGDLRQGMIDLAAEVIQKLPESPIYTALQQSGGNPVQNWMGFVNWFVPFGTLSNILSLWCGCVAAYYIYQIVLRWIKVIE